MQRGDLDSEDLVVDLVAKLGALDAGGDEPRLVGVNQGDRDSVPTSHLEDAIGGPDVEDLHRPPQPLRCGARTYNPGCLPRISFMSSEGGTAHRATDGLNI
jgi:hypothetical protein